jgi:2-oxoglutarate ferredoxin oxidoreductase subunit alpha
MDLLERRRNSVQDEVNGVLTGPHFIDGDHACCEGAIAAGCRFVAGYPITPSTEVVERIAERLFRWKMKSHRR